MACVWDSAYKSASVTLSDGDLTAQAPRYGYQGVRATKSRSSGKYYFEFIKKDPPTGTSSTIGVAQSTVDIRTDPLQSGVWCWIGNYIVANGSVVDPSWYRTGIGGPHAVAVDLDAGKIWFYSSTLGSWYNSGNPAAGTNPTLTGLSGTLYPIFNGGADEDADVAITANFGASTFAYTVPSGFLAWGTVDPIYFTGSTAVDITASGTLTVPRTLLGTADSSLSVEASGTLTYNAALVFSGNLVIGLETEGVLTVPRTLLGTADADVVLDADGTLTQQTELVIQATFTVLAQGDLSGTRMMIGNTTISITLGGTIGYEEIHATAALIVPAPILTAHAHDDDNASAYLTVPAPILTAFGGGWAMLRVPAPVLTATGTVQVLAWAALEVPAPILTATASTPTSAWAALEITAPILTAFGGGQARMEVPAPILTATGWVGHLAWAELTLPASILTATAKVGAVATGLLSVPAPTLEASGTVGAVARAALMLPAMILTARASVSPGVGMDATAVATETTYAVNLTTGAVTTLLLGEITRLVTAHGRLYGLRGSELVRLDGNTDGAESIPATVRFAPQTFGSNRAKRLSTVYLESREDDGLTLDVIADEQTAWRYQTATDTAPAYGTHKVKVGRGVKFHTAGLVVKNRNGGKMDIGGMELLVDTGAPRPRS